MSTCIYYQGTTQTQAKVRSVLYMRRTFFRRPLRSISGCPASRFSTRCASASIHQRFGENVSLGVPSQLHQPAGRRPSWSSRHHIHAKMSVPTATMIAMTTTTATNVRCWALSSTRQNGPSTLVVALVVGPGPTSNQSISSPNNDRLPLGIQTKQKQ